MEAQKTHIAKEILSKNSNSWMCHITVSAFKLCYRGTTIKQHGASTKTDTYTKGTEDPENKPTELKPGDFRQRCQNPALVKLDIYM
jgi:hypothetical protein